MHDKMGISMLFITHDLSLVADFANRTAIMYHGKLMEIGPTQDVLAAPVNPYTRALLLAIPKLHGDIGAVKPVAGNPPNPTESLPGCRFHPRCSFAAGICKESDPPLEAVGPGHSSACHFNAEMIDRPSVNQSAR
jgi:peptide/nickel transport system ATP-binding protein